MKLISITLLMLILNSCEDKESYKHCDHDRGVKTAKIYAKIIQSVNTDRVVEDLVREIHFNKYGQPLFISDTKDGGKEYERKYHNGMLLFIIATRKTLPDFYEAKQIDSLIENASYETDTAFVVSHSIDGRPIELKNPDGTTLIFEYFGCDKESQTLLTQNGDTIQQFQLIYYNRMLIETIWTPFLPMKSTRSTKYSEYQFDRNGNWVKRSYKHQTGSVITETRELTYY